MRTLAELIDTTSPAWPMVQEWLRSAIRPVEVLPKKTEHAEAALLQLQVTTRSALGAVAHECGGILLDHGWVRVLGAGCNRMSGSLASWNASGEDSPLHGLQGVLLVAHDALGGFFALDGGALGPGRGGAFYFAPDSLRWEDLGRGYSDLLHFLLMGDLDRFYGNHRWPGWRESVATLPPDQGLLAYPPLWTKEGKDPARAVRRPVPMAEILAFELDAARQLNGAL